MSLRALFIFGGCLAVGCAGAPASIKYMDTNPPNPRINEITTVRFVLEDYRGVPQAGTLVTFTVEGGNEGVILSPAMALSIKGSGEVSTQVIAGTGLNGVVVVANAGGMKIARSPPISFSGTVANSNQLTFQCGAIAGEASGGMHAIGAYDETRNLIAGVKLNCTAHVGDRNGDGVPGASVSFITEAGTIEPSGVTVTDVVGNVSAKYKTSLPLPHDTDPLVFNWNPDTTCAASDKALCNGEYLVPLWMQPNTWTQNPLGTVLSGNPAYNAMNLQEPRRRDPIRRLANGMQPLNNPRDNLVSMIAVTIGEEGFIDKNQNGQFDSDEEPVDTTEPFVDANDNGTYDMDEKYVDSNGNGVWDGKNGNWEANTFIWKQERIIWTGIPYGGLYPTMGQLDDGSTPEPVVRGAQPLMGVPLITCRGPPGPAAGFTLTVSDPWFNSLAQTGDGDGCEAVASSKNVTVEGTSKGFVFTYPPLRRYTFAVVDALPREPMPMTTPPSPGCYPPGGVNGSARQGWFAAVKCSFKASPEEGHTVILLDSVSGEIDNNIPNVP